MIGSGYERRNEGMGTPEAPVGPRVRVYDLAKDMGVNKDELVKKVRAMGIDIANHMSQLESADADRVRRAVERERHEGLVEERLTVDGTVIRRRSKTAAGGVAKAAAPAPAPAPVARAEAPAPAPERPRPAPVKPEPTPLVAETPVEAAPAPTPAPRPEPAFTSPSGAPPPSAPPPGAPS